MTKLYPSRFRSNPAIREAFLDAVEDEDDYEVAQMMAEFADSFVADNHPSIREEHAIYDQNRERDRRGRRSYHRKGA